MDEALQKVLNRLTDAALNRSILPVEGLTGPVCRIRGRECIVLCSNDYLGLASDPRLGEAARKAIDREGFGAGAARLVSGSKRAHHELEDALARFKGTEACLIFNSGYMANVGVLPALAGPGCAIFSDALNHASIIDGARLSKAEIQVFRHSDPEHLEGLLSEHTKGSRPQKGEDARPVRRLVVTEGVFSMDGDVSPLDRIAPLARRSGASLMVDDAHGTGVLGEGGRGTAAHLGVDHLIDVKMGTLGKALGAFGAYVCGSRTLIDYLINTCRSFIYTTGLPPSVAAAAREALRLLETEPERRERLHRNVSFLRENLRALGFNVRRDPTPIVPVIVGDARNTMKLAEDLLARGVLARGIRPPTVPEGTARIRVAVSAAHETPHLERALEAFESAGRSLGLLGGIVPSPATSGSPHG
ncbi:MAG: 8-amino-7-oxononanoate synthase [Nitrospinota bacterium]